MACRGVGFVSQRKGPMSLTTTSIPARFSSDTEPLTELLAASADKDEAAFADLYRQTSPFVYTTALQVVRSQAHAEEVTQEVYVQVWQQAGHYDSGKGTVLGWMRMLAHRRAVDRVRAVTSADLRDRRAAQFAATDESSDEWEDVVTRIDAARVHHALAELSAVQREAVSLMYLESRSMKEIASQLHLPLARSRPGSVTE